MAVNVERILERADASLRRAEAEHLARLRRTTNEAYRRLASEVRRKWGAVLQEAAGETPTFAEARARLLLEQLQPYTAALNYGDEATGVPSVVRDMVRTGAEFGVESSSELLSAYGVEAGLSGLAVQSAVIDQRAIDAAVRNSQARLSRHGAQAVSKIEDAVVNGLVRGKGPRAITREIREALRGDGRIPAGGLHYRAETIAQTELAIAKSEASKERYRENNVQQVQWYATLDERTCPWCGARHGMVYERDEMDVPAHPRCRCDLVPFRREFTEAGLVDVDYWQKSQAEIRQKVPKLKTGLTPFERNYLGKARYPRASWTPKSGWTRAR